MTFRKAIELEPRLAAAAHSNIGVALRKQGKWNEAIAAHSQALAIDPMFSHALGSLAEILATCSDSKLRDPNRALTLAKTAVRLNPTNPEHHDALGIARYRTEDWKGAVASLEKGNQSTEERG